MSPTTRSSAQVAEKLPSSAAQSATLEVSTASQAPQIVHGPKLSPLSYLTTQSARFGVWEVAIFNPTARAREYMWNQEKRTSYSFQCMLVLTADPTQYVLGDSHGKGMNSSISEPHCSTSVAPRQNGANKEDNEQGDHAK